MFFPHKTHFFCIFPPLPCHFSAHSAITRLFEPISKELPQPLKKPRPAFRSPYIIFFLCLSQCHKATHFRCRPNAFFDVIFSFMLKPRRAHSVLNRSLPASRLLRARYSLVFFPNNGEI